MAEILCKDGTSEINDGNRPACLEHGGVGIQERQIIRNEMSKPDIIGIPTYIVNKKNATGEERINDIDKRLTNLENMHKMAFVVFGLLGVGFIISALKG
jgi:hypothetical protein